MPLPSRYDIPLVVNPGNACALCCLTMAAAWFFPGRYDYQAIGKIAKARPGFVVWEFPYFLWFLKQGGQIVFWDDIDYALWVSKGFDALGATMPAQEFAYFKKMTAAPDALREDIAACLAHESFTFLRRKPRFDELAARTRAGELCTVVLNNRALMHEEGFELHQVLVLEVTETDVVFHNPLGGEQAQAAQKEPIAHFCHAWLEATACPSMTAYHTDS